jgi:hypothetical protein
MTKRITNLVDKFYKIAMQYGCRDCGCPDCSECTCKNCICLECRMYSSSYSEDTDEEDIDPEDPWLNIPQEHRERYNQFVINRAKVADRQLEDKLSILNSLFGVTRNDAYDICYDDGISYSWKIPTKKFKLSKMFKTFGKNTKDAINKSSDMIWEFPTNNRFNIVEIGVTIDDGDFCDLSLYSSLDDDETEWPEEFQIKNLANFVNEFYKKAKSL